MAGALVNAGIVGITVVDNLIGELCQLLDLTRSGLYYDPRPESEENLLVMR